MASAKFDQSGIPTILGVDSAGVTHPVLVDTSGTIITAAGGALTGVYPNAPTSIASAAVNTTLLAANANRKAFIISNDSTSKLYVLLDQLGTGVASATNFTYVVPAGNTLESLDPIFVGRIQGIWSSANGTAEITEVT